MCLGHLGSSICWAFSSGSQLGSSSSGGEFGIILGSTHWGGVYFKKKKCLTRYEYMRSKDGEVGKNSIIQYIEQCSSQSRRFCCPKNLCWSTITSDSISTGKHKRVFWSAGNILYLYFGYWLHRYIRMLKSQWAVNKICALHHTNSILK